MPEPTMDVSNVGNMVLMMANTELSANIQSVMVMASDMPFVGRG